MRAISTAHRVGFGAAYVVFTRLAVLLATSVDKLTAGLAQSFHRKERSCAIPQQALQTGTVMRFDANTRIDREPAVCIAQHLLGLKALPQAPAHEAAQDASAQGGLRLRHGGFVDVACPVEVDARRSGFVTSDSDSVPLHFLKNPIDHTHMEVHMLIEAGAKPVDERNRAQVQVGRFSLCRTGASRYQTLLHHAQKIRSAALSAPLSRCR